MALYPIQSITTSQKVQALFAPVDADGNSVNPDAGVTVTVDDPAVCSANFNFSSGPHGVLTIAGGATPGATNVRLSATFTGAALAEAVPVHVTQDPAVTFGLTFSAPTAK